MHNILFVSTPMVQMQSVIDSVSVEQKGLHCHHFFGEVVKMY